MNLITGAAGKTGRAVIAALAARGAPVRALVRSVGQATAMRALGYPRLETAVADLTDAAAVRDAAAGARAIYHLAPNMSPYEVAMGEAVIAAGQAAGVEHFVFHSVLHPQTRAMSHHWAKLQVEDRLFAAGFPFTILQPAAYMQNLLGQWERIVAEGRYVTPYPTDTAISLVDLADVAAVAARVLTETGHQGATYELVGTAPLAQRDVAAALGAALDRPVQAEEQAVADWARQARAGGMAATTVDALTQMFRYYAANGLVGNPRVLGMLLARPPTSLDEFLARHAARR